MEFPTWQEKQEEYAQKKARAKALKLRITCTICGEKAKLNCPCGTTQYCSTDCQRIDWRDRGHRKACKKIREERAAEAARAEAPTPPPEEVFYGPAPRSHADEVRVRIAAEHEAARVRREENPEREPLSARFGSRCPICLEEWDVNETTLFRICCCRRVCQSCEDEIGSDACPFCRLPCAETDAEELARLRRHVENEVPEAITCLGNAYREGWYGLVTSDKKAAKIYRRAVELGDVDAMIKLGYAYDSGSGVKLDKKKAERLYRAAADRGDAFAQSSLGTVLYSEEKFEEAVRYFVLAANQGESSGETNLGCCYGRGEGTEVDLGKARYWFERAAAKGHELAIENLAYLDEEDEDDESEWSTVDEDEGDEAALIPTAREESDWPWAEAAQAQARSWAEAAREEAERFIALSGRLYDDELDDVDDDDDELDDVDDVPLGGAASP